MEAPLSLGLSRWPEVLGMRYWQAEAKNLFPLGLSQVTLAMRGKSVKTCASSWKLISTHRERRAANLAEALYRELFRGGGFGVVQQTTAYLGAAPREDVKRRLSPTFPRYRQTPLDQVEATELLQAIRAIETRGSYDLAHRVLQVCGQVFRYGIATGVAPEFVRRSARRTDSAREASSSSCPH